MRLSLLCLLLLGLTSTVNADTILLEDFEDATITYTANPPDDLSDIANLDWYGRIAPDTSSLPGTFAYSNTQGNGFYSAHDTDGVPGAGSTNLIQLDWTNIDISNYENLNLSWFVAEDADPGFPGGNWDSTTSFRIEAQIDNGGFNQIFGIEAQNNSGNELPAVDTNFDGLGDGAVITDVFTQFDEDLANGAELDIRVIIQDLDTSGEDIGFDHLWLQGDFTGGAIPEPSTFAFLMVGGVALGFRRRRRNA